MFALLVAAALPGLPVPITPRVEITFPEAAPVTLSGPENSAQNAEYPWTHQQTLMSPRGDAAAVRFCWEIGKYDGCQVVLARPSQPTQRLKNSDVRRLLWTRDGQYLIGAGVNTVRLWNLTGGVRTVLPAPAPITTSLPHTSQITGLTLQGRDLCVQTQDQWYGRNSQRLGRSVSATRYALPTLRRLDVTTWPEGKKEADCSAP
ncbi:hypothetical protein QOL99_10900 [Deinococcus sp. MIMF12]|uniref:WD40 repeat domain-containing protein n=1 Tax=Deinococcus rhizophilus TaxID=3049544 RepID=A0ABT7JHW4_9DEIO|nr:hypothetical protein [Deinococcus rhizophilus]MDL2344656.1 hypothetical protein [Deinococcus rhizophilus]